jgi:hypothetical protein
MLATIILKLLGLFAIGVLIALIVTPLILRITEIVIYALALVVVLLRATLTSQLPPKEVFKAFPKLLKKSHKYVNSPIHESDATKGSIYHPNDIDNGHHASVSHVTTSEKPTDSKRYERNQNSLDVVKQPFIPDIPKKFRQIFHRIISFYSNYYGHSTKVEKNPQCSECRGNLLQC